MIFDDIEKVYNHALLNETQKEFYRKHDKITTERLLQYAPKWLWDDPQERNTISYIADVMIEIEKSNGEKNIKLFLKQMFGKHMEYQYTEIENGQRWGPKSNEFTDTLFEVKVMDFLISQGYSINLSKKKLGNGKQAEYFAEGSQNSFYVEAKNFEFHGVSDEVYNDLHKDSGTMTSYLSDYRQKRILNRFKNQYSNAMEKFKTLHVNYSIYIDVNLHMGVLGIKLKDYINELFNSNLDPNLVMICIFTWDKIHYYNNELKEYKALKRDF